MEKVLEGAVECKQEKHQEEQQRTAPRSRL